MIFAENKSCSDKFKYQVTNLTLPGPTSYPGSFFEEGTSMGRKDPGRSWSRDVKKFDCLRGVG